MFAIATFGNDVIAVINGIRCDLKIKHIIHNEDEYNLLRIGYNIDYDYKDVLEQLRFDDIFYIGHKEVN